LHVITWMHRMSGRLGAIALLALLVRAVLPAGFMLAEADTGSGRYLTLELCDAHGGVPKVVDLDTGKIMDAPVKGQASNDQPPCVFCASVVAMASPEPVVELVKFVAEHGVDFIEIRDLAPGRGIAAPPPPSTGPPISI
jgi:hypothetical protein